jgi:ferritin-like metal-binding protein YciE
MEAFVPRETVCARGANYQERSRRQRVLRPSGGKGHSNNQERHMKNTARDTFIVGLRNAHAMEVQARELMERQSERLDDYPDVKARVSAHLGETNEQLKRLEDCLQACGESTSTLKDSAQSLLANTQAMMHAMAGDEILKNTFANNAFEHFEIAAYKSLLALCPAAGMESAKAPLEMSLREEERMANWIDSNIGKVTMEYLARQQRQAA